MIYLTCRIIGGNIKKEIVTIITFVVILLILFIGVSFAYFLAVDSGQSNVISVGDLEIRFCEDQSCEESYSNFGQVIGTRKVNGQSVIESIYPYTSNAEAIQSTPYIFNIKNTGSLRTTITIKLTEDHDYTPSGGYSGYSSITSLYAKNIKIGINTCNNAINRTGVTVMSYVSLDENVILSNEVLNSGASKTYCLWTWLDENTPNDVKNTYFVANLAFSVEYIPN